MHGLNSILGPGCRQAITGTRIKIPKRRLFLFGTISPGTLKGKNRISQTFFRFPKAGTDYAGFGKAPKETSIFGGGNHESQGAPLS